MGEHRHYGQALVEKARSNLSHSLPWTRPSRVEASGVEADT